MTRAEMSAYTATDYVLMVPQMIATILAVVFFIVGNAALAIAFLVVAAGVGMFLAMRILARWRRPA